MATLTAPTLNQLRTEIRLMLGQSDANNSTWSDSELNGYINDGIRRYFLEISERAEGQFDKVVYLDLVAGEEEVDLPADFFEIKTLHRVSNQNRLILAYNTGVTSNFFVDQVTDANYLPSYFFRVNKLVLRPQPTSSETNALLLEYTAFPETLITGGDALGNGISAVFKEVIVMYAVYKAKIKEDLVNNSDNSGKAGQHLAYLETVFKETVGQRSKFPQFTVPYQSGGFSSE